MCSGHDGKLWRLSDLNIMEMTILVLHVEDIPAKYDREAIQQHQSPWNSTPSVQSISVLPIYISSNLNHVEQYLRLVQTKTYKWCFLTALLFICCNSNGIYVHQNAAGYLSL